MFFMTAMLAAFAIFATVGSQTTCKNAAIELALVLDGSRSIDANEARRARIFASNFVQRFTINGSAPGSTRVALAHYGSEVRVLDTIELNQYSTVRTLTDAIRGIRHRDTGATLTDLALSYMRLSLLPPHKVRPGVTKVGLVITDGHSNHPKRTNEQARLARQDNINMIAVGVGDNVNRTELIEIAGSASRVATVDSFAHLANIANKLVKMTCIRPDVDVLFVFSPCNLGRTGIRWTTDFMNRASAFQQDRVNRYRFSAVTGQCPGREIWPFTNDKAVLDSYISDYNRDHLIGLVQTAEARCFDASNGARGKAVKVAVLILDQLPSQGLNTLQATFGTLAGSGVTVFVSSVAGTQVTLTGATVLQGNTVVEQAKNLESAINKIDAA